MYKFERLIIYPLFFIVLFYIFTGENIQNNTTAQQVYSEIIAKNIKIVNDNGSTLLELKTNKNELFGSDYGEMIIYKKYKNSIYITDLEGDFIRIRDFDVENLEKMSHNYF